jgi:hypothetical protein
LVLAFDNVVGQWGYNKFRNLGFGKLSYDEPGFFIGFEWNFNDPYPRFLVLVSKQLFFKRYFLISIILQNQKIICESTHENKNTPSNFF